MKQIKTFFIAAGILLSNTLCSQTYPPLTVNPAKITAGTNTTVQFSGGPITFQNATCILIYIQQGTNIIYQSGSSIYYQGTNILVTSFYAASNSLVGAYDIIIFDLCKGIKLYTYTSKMSLALASIIDRIEEFFDFSIFPNPIERGQDFQILSSNHNCLRNSIALYDLNGKLIFEKSNLPKDYKFNSEALPAGNYIVQLIDDKGQSFSKKIQVISK